MATTARYTSITYTKNLVNFRTTFEDASFNDNYDISFNSNLNCNVNMEPIPITEADLKEGFATGNCASEATSASSYTGEKVMIAAIREKLNQDLTTATALIDKSVKQRLLEFINAEDVTNNHVNRIQWINIQYGNVALATFAQGLTGTDLAITTYDIVTNDVVNFIFRFSGGPRSVDGATPSYYTVKIPFVVTAVGPSANSADTPLPAHNTTTTTGNAV
jgi:hypothetical protein